MRSRSVWLTALSIALVLAGCGGEQAAPPAPRLPQALAQDLASESEAVARSLEAGDSCGAAEQARQLQQAVIDAINQARVPNAFHEELQGAVNALAGEIICVPPADEEDEDGEDDNKGKNGKGKGKGGKD